MHKSIYKILEHIIENVFERKKTVLQARILSLDFYLILKLQTEIQDDTVKKCILMYRYNCIRIYLICGNGIIMIVKIFVLLPKIYDNENRTAFRFIQIEIFDGNDCSIVFR